MRYQGRRAELIIGHVSQDDEVTEIREPVWQRGALNDETAGRVGANHNQERRQTLAMVVSVSTTRVLQIGESTLLPNGCNNIVRFVPRLLGCFGCLLASCFVVATYPPHLASSLPPSFPVPVPVPVPTWSFSLSSPSGSCFAALFCHRPYLDTSRALASPWPRTVDGNVLEPLAISRLDFVILRRAWTKADTHAHRYIRSHCASARSTVFAHPASLYHARSHCKPHRRCSVTC
jgi:hypothetical protein